MTSRNHLRPTQGAEKAEAETKAGDLEEVVDSAADLVGEDSAGDSEEVEDSAEVDSGVEVGEDSEEDSEEVEGGSSRCSPCCAFRSRDLRLFPRTVRPTSR